MITNLALLVFPLLMAFAASSDLLTMRISNKLVMVLAAGFLVLAIAAQMPPQEFALHVGCAALVLVVTFTLFSFGWIGGGDAKLAAATALWLGFGLTFPYLLYASLIGGLMTIALLLVRRWPLPPFMTRVRWIERLHDVKSGVPYGIALAAAGLLTYSDTTIFQHFTG
jgi:prepilin peptidase CpaA